MTRTLLLAVFAVSTCTAVAQDASREPLRARAAGEYEDADGSTIDVKCILEGKTLTLGVGKKKYVLTKQDEPPAEPKKKLDQDQARAAELYKLMSAGDRKKFEEYVGKELKTADDRQGVLNEYAHHSPFVGTFKNSKVTATLGEDHTGLIRIGPDDKGTTWKVAPPKYDPKARHKFTEPFNAGPPLLLDLLSGFGPEGYDLWLNTFLTADMRDVEGVLIRAVEVHGWAAVPESMHDGQRAAIRKLLKSLGVSGVNGLERPGKKWLDFNDEYLKALDRHKLAQVDLGSSILRHNIFEK